MAGAKDMLLETIVCCMSIFPISSFERKLHNTGMKQKPLGRLSLESSLLLLSLVDPLALLKFQFGLSGQPKGSRTIGIGL
jgi:hypothetical protein